MDWFVAQAMVVMGVMNMTVLNKEKPRRIFGVFKFGFFYKRYELSGLLDIIV